MKGQLSWFISVCPDGSCIGLISRKPSGNHLMSTVLPDPITDVPRPIIDLIDQYGAQRVQSIVNNLAYSGEGENLQVEGLHMVKMPGGVDPVLSVGPIVELEDESGSVYTHRATIYSKPGEIHLLDQTMNLDTMKREKLYSFHSGVYQSIGHSFEYYEEDGQKHEKIYYRYFSDQKEGSISFFEYDSKTKEFTKPTKQKRICEGIKINTPMLSDDGQYMSMVTKEGSTKIFRLSRVGNTKDIKCHEVLHLTDFPTGKVAFNMKNRVLAMHYDNLSTRTRYFRDIGKESKDVLSMKFQIKNKYTDREKWIITDISRLSLEAKSGNGTYYPRIVTSEKGNVYVFAVNDTADKYYIDIYNKESFDYNSFLPSFNKTRLYETYNDIYKIDNSYTILGSLWGLRCNKVRTFLRPQDAKVIARSMTNDQCRYLVKKYWRKKYKKRMNPSLITEEMKEVKRRDLLAICPQVTAKGVREDQSAEMKYITSVGSGTGPEMTAPEILYSHCIGCHEEEDIPYGNIDIFKMTDIYRMMFAQDELRMPPTGSDTMSEREKRKVKVYLELMLCAYKEGAPMIWGENLPPDEQIPQKCRDRISVSTLR
jgi:hypothetical protein